jgi:hypothetical protein
MRKVTDEKEELTEELTKEQVDALRIEHEKNLTDTIQTLKLEAEYETLLTTIDEQRTKRLAVNLQYINMKDNVKQKEGSKKE